MISKELAEKIVAELPSASLRKAIEEQNWQFSDRDLFLIAAKYCKILQTRWALLAEIIEQADEAISSWAKSYLAYEQRVKEKFCEADEKCVYEVRFSIKDYNEDIAERQDNYIYKTFNGAQKFYKKYLLEEECDDYYIQGDIVKRLLGEYATEENDYKGYCELDIEGEICSFDCTNEKEIECNLSCENCKRPCVQASYPEFPKFLENYSIVRYTDEYDKKRVGYGFVPLEIRENEALVISMEGEYIDRYMNGILPDGKSAEVFGDEVKALLFHQHRHIELPKVEKLEYKDLPEKYQKIYDKLSVEYKKAHSSD